MNVEIAERLAKRRREAGYSQESLAERLGVTRQAVSKWERSESSPDTDNLIGLAKLYGVSLDELLNVDPSIADDVDFEVADKAPAQAQDPYRAQAQAGNTQVADPNESSQPQSSGKESFFFADDSFNLTDDDGSAVKINWHDGVHVKDGKTGEEVHVGWRGIRINEKGAGGAAWTNADGEDFSDAHLFSREGWESVNVKYKTAVKFPIYVLVIIAYLLMGFFAQPLQTAVGSVSPWAYGIFLIAIIPTYYMLVHAFASKGAVRFIQGFYPVACMVFFLWMWLVMGVPHPTWVVFLTIPVIEWICESNRKSQRRRRKAAVEADTSATPN